MYDHQKPRASLCRANRKRYYYYWSGTIYPPDAKTIDAIGGFITLYVYDVNVETKIETRSADSRVGHGRLIGLESRGKRPRRHKLSRLKSSLKCKQVICQCSF